jgi:phage gp45-like
VSDVQSQIDRLYRRVLMMVTPVRINTTDDTGNVLKAQIGVSNTPEILDNVPVLQFYGFAVNPPPKTDAIAIFGNGNRSNPVIVGTNNIESRPRNYKPGEVGIFTNEGDTLKFNQGKAVALTAGESFGLDTKAATLKGSSQITLDTPNTHHTGDVKSDGKIDASQGFFQNGQPIGGGGSPGPPGPAGPMGPAGPAGATGPTGPAGEDGNTVLNGIGNPPAGVGVAGDFYINTAATSIWGPKTTTWPANGLSMIGPQGPTGATGPAGPTGATGTTGAQGSTGPQGPAGPTGPTGATGPAGPAGADSTVPGPPGATGPAGPQGPTGATGPQGPNWQVGTGLALNTGTTPNTLNMSVPVTIANGGTNATTAGAGADNLHGFTGTTAGIVRRTGAATYSLDGTAYLTGNQTVTLSGDVTGSGTTSIATTLANSGVAAGTYQGLTVDAKGRVTGASNMGYVTGGPYLPTAGGTVSGALTTGTLTVNGNITESGQYHYFSSATGSVNGAGGTFIYGDNNWFAFHVGTGNQGILMQNGSGGNFGVWYADGHLALNGSGASILNQQGNGVDMFYFKGVSGNASGVILHLDGVAGWGPADAFRFGNSGNRLAGINSNGVSFGWGPFVDISSFAAHKSNIEPLSGTDAASVIERLKPVRYHHNTLNRDHYGFLIDDLVTDFPEAVAHDRDGAPEGYSPTMIIAPLVTALQELTRRVKELEARLST